MERGKEVLNSVSEMPNISSSLSSSSTKGFIIEPIAGFL